MLSCALRNPSEYSKMYPRTIKQGFGDLVNWVSNIGGAPIKWEKNQLCMIKHKSKWYTTSFLLAVYICYMTLQLINSVIEKRKLQEYNLLLFVFLAYSAIGVFYLVLIFRAFDLILVVNSTLQFFDYFHAKFAKKQYENANIRLAILVITFVLRILVVGIKFIAISWGILCILQPFLVISPLSLIPAEYRMSMWIRVLAGFPWGILVFWLILCLEGAGVISAFSAILIWIGYYQCEDQLVLQRGTYWTRPWLRTPISLRNTMVAMKILITLVHKPFQDFTLLIQMLLTRCVHLCCFLVIRHHHEMPAFETFIYAAMSVCFVFGWLAAMQCAALLHTTSVRMIRSWRNCAVSNQKERKIWQKTRKSMKPIGFKVGNCYVVKPITVILICETYVKGTIRLLLTFRKQ